MVAIQDAAHQVNPEGDFLCNALDDPGFLISKMRNCTAGGKGSNKLNHILGIILSSLPLGQGGLNPYQFVPSCINDAANHMYHDEVC